MLAATVAHNSHDQAYNNGRIEE